mmetsp:Transcript_17592/g.56871  ORF Transcript_17592/g.56871 Transcript_17592/m.56871 type:complete len:234 (+) Transcript_17592:209-910(+)
MPSMCWSSPWRGWSCCPSLPSPPSARAALSPAPSAPPRPLRARRSPCCPWRSRSSARTRCSPSTRGPSSGGTWCSRGSSPGAQVSACTRRSSASPFSSETRVCSSAMGYLWAERWCGSIFRMSCSPASWRRPPPARACCGPTCTRTRCIMTWCPGTGATSAVSLCARGTAAGCAISTAACPAGAAQTAVLGRGGCGGTRASGRTSRSHRGSTSAALCGLRLRRRPSSPSRFSA